MCVTFSQEGRTRENKKTFSCTFQESRWIWKTNTQKKEEIRRLPTTTFTAQATPHDLSLPFIVLNQLILNTHTWHCTPNSQHEERVEGKARKQLPVWELNYRTQSGSSTSRRCLWHAMPRTRQTKIEDEQDTDTVTGGAYCTELIPFRFR